MKLRRQIKVVPSATMGTCKEAGAAFLTERVDVKVVVGVGVGVIPKVVTAGLLPAATAILTTAPVSFSEFKYQLPFVGLPWNNCAMLFACHWPDATAA